MLCFSCGHLGTRAHLMDDLLCGHMIHGPTIIIDKNSTISVELYCKAKMIKRVLHYDVMVTPIRI